MGTRLYSILPHRSQSLHAFTLIELLVVIAIVGVLAAILMPVYGKAREGARRAMCINNLRQHGIAWYLYLDDHNEYFPKATRAANRTPTDIQCDDFTFGGKAGSELTYAANTRPLNRYLDVNNTSSAEIFHCPDDAKEFADYAAGETLFDWLGTSYYCNWALLQFGYNDYIQRPLSTITRDRSKVMLEMCYIESNPGHGGEGWVGSAPVMVLFVDGHVKGPYKWDIEFDRTPTGTEPQKPVYEHPDTTGEAHD